MSRPLQHGKVGIFCCRGWLRIEDVWRCREFALIGASRPGAELLFRFLDWYVHLVNALAKWLLYRVPAWFFNGLFWMLRFGKAVLLREKLRFVLNDPQGMSDHPEWRGVL